jgi:hypothetical protein
MGVEYVVHTRRNLGTFHGNAGDVGSIGLEGFQCDRQIVRQALLENALVLLVDDGDEVIV